MNAMVQARETPRDGPGEAPGARMSEYVTLTLAGQLFGIPVLAVRDVLGQQRITPIPLAPPEVAGALNLRGRIVTALDMRRRLGLPVHPNPDEARRNSVVVDVNGELYSLFVDRVGEVLTLSDSEFEPNPPTLTPAWRAVSRGIHQLDASLLVILDVERLIDFAGARAGAPDARNASA